MPWMPPGARQRIMAMAWERRKPDGYVSRVRTRTRVSSTLSDSTASAAALCTNFIAAYFLRVLT